MTDDAYSDSAGVGFDFAFFGDRMNEPRNSSSSVSRRRRNTLSARARRVIGVSPRLLNKSSTDIFVARLIARDPRLTFR